MSMTSRHETPGDIPLRMRIGVAMCRPGVWWMNFWCFLFRVNNSVAFVPDDAQSPAQQMAIAQQQVEALEQFVMHLDAELHVMPVNDDGSRALNSHRIRFIRVIADSVRRFRRTNNIPVVEREHYMQKGNTDVAS